MNFDPLTLNFWTPIGVAILCGAIIGFERQWRGKPAGVRTSILICLSTQVFIRLGAVTLVGQHADATRVLGQIVVGVGFLGAGVMFARQGVVTGVTTAAVIWILAAVGSVIGMGHYLGAIALSFVTVMVLQSVDMIENRVRNLRRGVHADDKDDDNDRETETTI